MKVECKNNMLSFTNVNDNEKVFVVYATCYGCGDSFARMMTDSEIVSEGWFDPDVWSKDIEKLKIGERSTYVGFAGGHNFITRLQ